MEESKTLMIDASVLRGNFREIFHDEPRIFSAPGRVNLIGEHTDYNEGFLLPFAIQMRTLAAVSARSDRRIRVRSLTLSEEHTFSLDEASNSKKSWWTYIRGMADLLERRGFQIRGANILIDSDVPSGAGLSSSAALEISVGLALTSFSDKTIDPKDVALTGQQVEQQYIGVRSGIMDQFTSALGRRGHALLIDCRTLEIRHLNLNLDDLVLVVCDSKVKHDLAASEYNKRRQECEAGVEQLRVGKPNARSLRDITADEFSELADLLEDVVKKRCRHVVTENERVLSAVAAIEKNDPISLGELTYSSHTSLRDDYEVSCPELDYLVESASEIDGVYGARMTGGGFGGCTINLLEERARCDFQTNVREKYRSKFGQEPAVCIVKASNGAYEV